MTHASIYTMVSTGVYTVHYGQYPMISRGLYTVHCTLYNIVQDELDWGQMERGSKTLKRENTPCGWSSINIGVRVAKLQRLGQSVVLRVSENNLKT